MDLLLHIGCEKTGTTSLQFWLDQNAAALAGRGIVYSSSLGRPNNRRISYYGLETGSSDEGLRREGISTPEQHQALQAQIAHDLVAEVEQARQDGCTCFVISNEHCHSRLKNEVAIGRVHALLAPLFDTVRVCCALRPQMDTCLSLASTLARNGGLVSREWIDRQMQPGSAYFALNRVLQRWAAVFGQDAIMPVSFRRHPDSIRYFEDQLEVTDMALPRRKTVNEALDYRVMALLNAIQAARVGTVGQAPGPSPAPPFFINELPIEQRLTLDRASAQTLQARFEGGNAELCAQWPTIEPADLLPDWQRYPQIGTIDRLNSFNEIGPLLSRILDRLHGEAVFERARLMAVTSERDLALKRPAAALQACREGLVLARQAAQVAVYQKRMERLITALETREKQLHARPAIAGRLATLPEA